MTKTCIILVISDYPKSICVESVHNFSKSKIRGNFELITHYDVNGSENIIWKYNFAFLQSFFNYSKSFCLKNVF